MLFEVLLLSILILSIYDSSASILKREPFFSIDEVSIISLSTNEQFSSVKLLTVKFFPLPPLLSSKNITDVPLKFLNSELFIDNPSKITGLPVAKR